MKYQHSVQLSQLAALRRLEGSLTYVEQSNQLLRQAVEQAQRQEESDQLAFEMEMLKLLGELQGISASESDIQRSCVSLTTAIAKERVREVELEQRGRTTREELCQLDLTQDSLLAARAAVKNESDELRARIELHKNTLSLHSERLDTLASQKLPKFKLDQQLHN